MEQSWSTFHPQGKVKRLLNRNPLVTVLDEAAAVRGPCGSWLYVLFSNIDYVSTNYLLLVAILVLG